MKSRMNPQRPDIFGHGKQESDRQASITSPNHWQQKLGYCSIFAAVPTLLASQVHATRSHKSKEPAANFTEGLRTRGKLNLSHRNPALLKRQSQFILPHQKSRFGAMAMVAGVDDCPGDTLPAGTYTATAALTVSGDTTHANSTIDTLRSFYSPFYPDYNAFGPDHVYTFTLTDRGGDPQVEISTTSGNYRPLIYVLVGAGICPGGTGNTGDVPWTIDDSRWSRGTTARLNLNYAPLNVPIHLFVDSAFNDSAGAGPYTIKMQDVTIAPAVACAEPNPIDCAEPFVRQHYRDFLNREPDADGLAFWTNSITSCGADAQCVEVKRINNSAAFFLSIEFQESGYLVYRFYKAAFGNLAGAPVPVRYTEFLPDAQRVGQGVIVNQTGWQAVLENNKQAFANEFVQRARFTSAYPDFVAPAAFVDALFANAGVTPSPTDREAAIAEFGSASTIADTAARARALRRVADNSTLKEHEFNRAFVLTQYFGYLRRNPNDAPDGNFEGYNFWLNKLNQFNGDFIQAEMVKAFISSNEYRRRFGP